MKLVNMTRAAKLQRIEEKYDAATALMEHRTVAQEALSLARELSADLDIVERGGEAEIIAKANYSKAPWYVRMIPRWWAVPLHVLVAIVGGSSLPMGAAYAGGFSWQQGPSAVGLYVACILFSILIGFILMFVFNAWGLHPYNKMKTP